MSEPSTFVATLLRSLDEATAADLDALDQNIAAARGRLASLEHLRKLLSLRLNGPAAKRTGGGGGLSTGKMRQQRQKQIVEYLAQRGPRTHADIAKDCSIPTGSITAVLDSPWFQKTSQGVHITPQARREVLDS